MSLEDVKTKVPPMQLACFVCLFLGWLIPGFLGWVLIAAGLLFFVSFAMLLSKYWHCPGCSRSLPRRNLDIAYCPHCGKKLETE